MFFVFQVVQYGSPGGSSVFGLNVRHCFEEVSNVWIVFGNSDVMGCCHNFSNPCPHWNIPKVDDRASMLSVERRL